MCIDIVLKTIIKIGIFLKQIRTDTQENMLDTLKSSRNKESKLCFKFIIMPVDQVCYVLIILLIILCTLL